MTAQIFVVPTSSPTIGSSFSRFNGRLPSAVPPGRGIADPPR
jgi:hypothetical protein